MKSIELFSPIYPDFTSEYISQGLVGDCWLISSILTLSFNQSGKDLLKKIFFIKNGLYVIKLFNQVNVAKYIEVKPIYLMNNNAYIRISTEDVASPVRHAPTKTCKYGRS